MFNCDDCEVYFAPKSKQGDLPTNLDPLHSFDADAIANHFTKGTDNGDGTWSPSGFSPADVKYIAIKMDSDAGIL